MPEHLAPGVYVEELSVQPKPIEGVPTSTTGFIGPSHKGPTKRATLVTNLAEFSPATASVPSGRATSASGAGEP